MAWFKKDKQPEINTIIRSEVEQALKQITANTHVTNDGLRQRIASAISGGYDYSDTMHNVFLDFGYPQQITFAQFWNMYRRFGIAKNVVDLPVDTGWMTDPEVEGSAQFNSEFLKLVDDKALWQRVKGLDNRQRVGRYAGLFMRVRDGKNPSLPIEGKLNGVASLVQMVPLYEGQLTILETDNNPLSDNYGLPTMYQFNGGAEGNRSEKVSDNFSIHPSRIIIAAEESDNGGVEGISALEAPFNSLMDLRKIIGAGGEGFYKNAAQSMIFNLKDAASAKVNAPLLAQFNEQYDDFSHNRMRRSMWTPGMEAKSLDSNLIQPKEFFMNALNDVAAASKIPATILIGQQTGRLASGEDSIHFLSMVNSRRKNFMTGMINDVLDWMMLYGVLPMSTYDVEWDDLLSAGDEEKLGNADKMSTINVNQFRSGGPAVFTSDEIREAAGFESEEEAEIGSEELPEDEEIEDVEE